MMDDTEEIILLTLTLRRKKTQKKDAEKREIIMQNVQKLNFGCEIFLLEENSMVNLIALCKN